jgi:NAD(P)-dependent dehydrogenase (short-subunit alcohol dehydrogenase family)
MKKTIFITGASSGLGKAAAKLFQSNGWNVIATMRNPDKETELNTLENVTLQPLDVTNVEQIQQTAKEAIAKHDIDVVLNNAGYGLIGALEAISDEQLVKQIDTNLLGVIRVTQAFVPYFREKKSGLFLTTTSIGGLVTFPLDCIYHATKWALEGWSESMSFELGLHNIGIKTIAPGGIKTRIFSCCAPPRLRRRIG